MAKPPRETEYSAPIHPKSERATPAKNRKTFDLKSVQDVLVDHGYSPAEAMVRIATQAEAESGDETYEPNVRRAFLEMSMRANSELLQYVAPKLTRSELSGPNGGPIRTTRDLTDDELAAIAAGCSTGTAGKA